MDATRWRARRGEVGKRPVRGVPGGAGGVGGGVGIVPKRSAALAKLVFGLGRRGVAAE